MSKVVRAEITPKYFDEPLERMIKRFSKKVKKERIIDLVLEKRHYEKPSVKRKRDQKRRKKVLDKLRKIHRTKEGK
jgi:ribosomal protein S21